MYSKNLTKQATVNKGHLSVEMDPEISSKLTNKNKNSWKSLVKIINNAFDFRNIRLFENMKCNYCIYVCSFFTGKRRG